VRTAVLVFRSLLGTGSRMGDCNDTVLTVI
jgi:hypothetical protein